MPVKLLIHHPLLLPDTLPPLGWPRGRKRPRLPFVEPCWHSGPLSAARLSPTHSGHWYSWVGARGLPVDSPLWEQEDKTLALARPHPSFSEAVPGAGGLQLTQAFQTGGLRAVFVFRQIGLAHIVCLF